MYTKIDEYKDTLKSDEQQYDAYIVLEDGTKVDSDISAFKPIYNLGDKIVGNFVKKRVEFTLFNTNLYNITNKEFEAFVGLKVNGKFNYISLGKFVANKPEVKDEKTDECSITAQDYSLKFKVKYEPVITFPCTISSAIQQICSHLNIVYKTNSFINADYMLEEFFIDEEATFFDVIKTLAETGFANAYMDNSNSLIIKSPKKTSDYSFALNEIFELKKQDNKFGPLNAVVASRLVADDGSTTEDVYARNEQSITQNGIYEYKIIQNDAIDYDRQTAVDNMLAGILDFQYVPAIIEAVYNPAMEVGDLIEVPDVKTDTSFLLYVKEITADLASGLMTIESSEETQTETDYKAATVKDKRKRTEYKVNKMEGKITQMVQETTEQNEKINRVVQTVDELNSKISDVADITTSKNSNNGYLEFEGINESEPIRVEIRPLGQNISYLYPRNSLYPSKTLYPTRRTLRFTNTTTGELTEYELPSDLLYHDSENYDEFILDYDSQTCLVNKRVGYNADGTTYILATPRTIDYPYPVVPLTDGDYKVELLGYDVAYLFVRLMVQNIYTTQFATKAEVHSEISAASTSIKAEVNADIETLDKNVNRELINVNARLELKVNTKDLVSELNASADVIDLKSNRFKLDSDNMQITEDGTMTCENAVIKGSAVINDVVTIDKNGIEMADGTSIVGATGVFSIFEYDGEVSGYNPVRNGEYQSLGASYVYELGVVETERMILDAYIPENFTIKEAYIHFCHYPIDAIWQNASIGAGYCRELKLYKANAESMETKYLIGSEYFHTYEDDTSEEITNAFGVASYTPSSYGLSDIETIDLANKLTTGKNRLIIKSVAKMPSGDDETIMKQCALRTGMVQATLVVLGFSK